MKTYSRKKGDSPSNVIIHINELCRLCLAKEEEMVPLYNDDTVPLSLRILACLNIEVGSRLLAEWSLRAYRIALCRIMYHTVYRIVSCRFVRR
jgi:hypothetical protein